MKKIEKRLLEGYHVIMDRYSYSGVAYSIVRGLHKMEACQSEIGLYTNCSYFLGLIKPDLVVLLIGDPKNLSKREGYGSEIYDFVDFQTLVSDNLINLFHPDYWIVRFKF